MNVSLKRLTRAGIIAALYTVATLIVFPVASGAVQFRLSEGLTLLPLLYFEAVPALFVGCLVSNLITGCALLDIIFGSLITLVAAFITYLVGRFIKKKVLSIIIGGIFPVLLNALLLPLIWVYCYGAEYVYFLQVCFLLLGQTVSVYAVGVPLILSVRKMLSPDRTP